MKEYRLEEGFNIKKFVIIFSAVLLITYGVFNARNLLFGPSIEIWSPVTEELSTTENTITIKGKVKNATFLNVNGRPMTMDREGNFRERILLTPGLNILDIDAIDRFKKEESKIIKVFYDSKSEQESDALLLDENDSNLSKNENELNQRN